MSAPQAGETVLPEMVCPSCGNVVLQGRRYCVNWLGCEWSRPVDIGREPQPGDEVTPEWDDEFIRREEAAERADTGRSVGP